MTAEPRESVLLRLTEKAAQEQAEEYDDPRRWFTEHYIDISAWPGEEEALNLIKACNPETIAKLCRVVEAARKVRFHFAEIDAALRALDGDET